MSHAAFVAHRVNGRDERTICNESQTSRQMSLPLPEVFSDIRALLVVARHLRLPRNQKYDAGRKWRGAHSLFDHETPEKISETSDMAIAGSDGSNPNDLQGTHGFTPIEAISQKQVCRSSLLSGRNVRWPRLTSTSSL